MSRLPGLRWRSCRHHHSQKQGWSQSREGASSPQLGYSLCLPGWVLSNLLTHCKSQIYPSKTKIVTFEGFPTDLQKGLTRRLNEEFQTLVPAASLCQVSNTSEKSFFPKEPFQKHLQLPGLDVVSAEEQLYTSQLISISERDGSPAHCLDVGLRGALLADTAGHCFTLFTSECYFPAHHGVLSRQRDAECVSAWSTRDSLEAV
uniref:Uncharacterized protein n=1 Tax=Molossus molossus TaxID=27622 RepID=A0A7J8E3H0_MOLMO|nr:hypothetical protein HJG59_009033 [Molossus molossus]